MELKEEFVTTDKSSSKSYDDEGQGFMSKGFAERHAYSSFYGE